MEIDDGLNHLPPVTECVCVCVLQGYLCLAPHQSPIYSILLLDRKSLKQDFSKAIN